MKSLILFLLITCSLFAREPYDALLTVSGESARVSAPNLLDLKRDLKGDNIQALIPIYTPTSALNLLINLRGIDVISSFATNSTELVVSIPQAGITTSFDGGTRDESVALFREYIRDAGPKNGALLKAYAKYSPIDPIAGNPNSLLYQMAANDFETGKLSPLAGCTCGWSAQPIVHQFQAGLRGGRAFSDSYDTTLVKLPLRYSYSPNLNWAFIIDAPFSYLRNGGASSIAASIGTGIRVPIFSNWSVTGIVRFGTGGTMDLCTSGNFFSTGLLSQYNWNLGKVVLGISNYAGYFTSTNFWLTGLNFNYHIQTYAIKNGLSLTSCEWLSLCNRPLNWNVSVVDTYFTKGGLFIRHYDEIGVNLIGNGINPCLEYDALIFGFTYQFGEKHYRGYMFNLDYQF